MTTIINTRTPPDGLDELIERFIDYPLPTRAPAHFTVRERRLAKGSEYAPVAISTAHGTYTDAYLVTERPISDNNGVKEFERLWSTIPPSFSHAGRSVGFDYPGYLGGYGSPGSLVTSGLSGAQDANGRLVVTKTSHGLTTSDYVEINYVAAAPSGFGGTSRYRSVHKIVATTSNTFTLGVNFFGGTWLFSITSYRSIAGFPTRKLRSLKITPLIVHEFALPGVTTGVTTPDDFAPTPEQQFIVEASGEPTTYLNAVTKPSNTEWVASVLAGERFVSDSIVEPYIEGGDILHRITTLLPYLK